MEREENPTSSDRPAVGDETSGVRVLERAFELLRILAMGGERGVRLTDIVGYSGLRRPTVHRLLQTMIALRIAEQDGATRRYRVGQEISLLGLSRPAQFTVRSAAEPYLTSLANVLGDTVFLTIRAGTDSVAIERKTGSYPIKVLSIDVGVRRPLGVGAAGIMLLAELPAAEADHICAINETRMPPDAPTMVTIRSRVAFAREHRYAYAEVGVLPGTSALSVPVFDGDGNAVAALAVSAMRERLSEAELPRLLSAMRATATQITRRLVEMQRGASRVR